jgi:hypothetical protein
MRATEVWVATVELESALAWSPIAPVAMAVTAARQASKALAVRVTSMEQRAHSATVATVAMAARAPRLRLWDPVVLMAVKVVRVAMAAPPRGATPEMAATVAQADQVPPVSTGSPGRRDMSESPEPQGATAAMAVPQPLA